MATVWCDRMELAAEGHTENVCNGYATVRIEYAQPGYGAELVAYVCDGCGQAMRDDSQVAVFAVRRLA